MKRNIFLIFATVTLGISLAACNQGKEEPPTSDTIMDTVVSSSEAGDNSAVEVHEGEEQDKVDQINPDDHDPFQDRDDQGNPVEHATESESHDGQYAYKVGDTTIYTQHDLDQWIVPRPNNPEYKSLDLNSMLIDLWCQGNRGGIFQNDVGYSYVLDGNNTKGLWFDSPDPDNEGLYHAVVIWYQGEDAGFQMTIRMYDCPKPAGGYYTFLNDPLHGIHPEIAPLILYSIEQMEIDPSGASLDDLDLGRNFYCD